MSIVRYPFPILTIAMILGIGIEEYIPSDIISVNVLIIICFSLVFFLYLLDKKTTYNKTGYPLLLIILFIAIGALLACADKDQKKDTHYSHFLENKKEYTLQASISEKLKSNSVYDRYVVSLINDPNTEKEITGKLLIFIKKSTGGLLLPGNRILFRGSLNYLSANGNQYGFNRYQFLIKKEIFAQIFVKRGNYQMIKRKSFSLKLWSGKIENWIVNKWRDNGLSLESQNLLLAIVFGDKSFIPSETITSFSNAGVIHTLAVSGLHVGIIYLMVQSFLLYLIPFQRFRFAVVLITVLILWMYALFVGFKPSVTRAVVLFSLFSISTGLNRLEQAFNTLAISAFLLLVYKPAFMFDIGFQLSYAAVLSILWFYPKLNSLLEFNHWIFKKTWNLVCVSISAQIGVLPLLLLYFHKFPSLFPITNLIVIPIITLILWMGIGSLALFILPFKIPIYFKIINCLIHNLELFIKLVSDTKIGLIENIAFDRFQVVCMYAAIILFGLAKGWKDKKVIIIGLSFVLLLQVYAISKKARSQNSQEFVVLHDYRTSLGGIRLGDEFFCLLDQNEGNQSLISYQIEKYTAENYTLCHDEQYETSAFIKERNFIVLPTIKILITDQKTNPKLISLMKKGDVVWIKDSPNIEFEKLRIPTGLIFVADGSNSYSKVNRWKGQLINHKFHSTSIDGAFILVF